MTGEQQRGKIKSKLAGIVGGGSFAEAAKQLLGALGYQSRRIPSGDGDTDNFLKRYPAPNPDTKSERDLRQCAKSLRALFQITDTEIRHDGKPLFGEYEKGNNESFLFVAAELRDTDYARGRYASFTREVNKRFNMPVVVLYRVGDRLTAALAGHRPHKGDDSRDVLEMVTLIKDIRLQDPHHAHLDILADLSLPQCAKWMDDNKQDKNFDGLQKAWLANLDIEELNKNFYRRLFKWFERVLKEARFPTGEKKTLLPEEHAIRLITRMLFVWFAKEKGLISEELFNKQSAKSLLNQFGDGGDSYYRAVLQNLFFATLNTPIDKRGFSAKKQTTHRDFSYYRYESLMRDPQALLALFKKTPFINGGIFDCLDSWEANNQGGYRIDMFSDPDPKTHGYARKKAWANLRVPDDLFFDADGLFPLLKHYKFTVEENTPVEQEVALDPELLGKVFENLLAANVDETRASARRRAGAYYTPRTVVDYMVDESLIAALAERVEGGIPKLPERLRNLLDYRSDYETSANRFMEGETEKIARAIADIKVLDPAVGSGAFPMGVLHKLTLALKRLDPDNALWQQIQKERAQERAKRVFDEHKDKDSREEELGEINDTFERYRDSDYGRKMYLIQNSIFGVDIQPVACQIAKLRFFISLAIEQEKSEDPANNFGIKPLPNLETRFVVANTLLKMRREISSQKAQMLERELRKNRENHFHATTRNKKMQCYRKETKLRAELAKELERAGMPSNDAGKIANWNILDQNACADWFDSEYMFNVARDFDIVIGNPPYIRHELFSRQKPDLQAAYRGFYTGTADIYTYFYHRGLSELRDGGHLCFITSNKFMRVSYGKKLRALLAKQTKMRALIDFGELPVFDVGVDPAIALTQNQPPEDAKLTAAVIKDVADISRIVEHVSEKGFALPASELSDSEWTVEGGNESRELVKKIRADKTPLSSYVNKLFFCGVVTGYNDAFIIDEQTKEQLINDDAASAELIRPWLNGHEIKKWHGQWSQQYILFVLHDTDIDSYPAVKAHLESFKSNLLNRAAPGADKWFAIQAQTAYWRNFERPKIVYNETSKELHAYVDYDNLYVSKTGFIIVAPDNEFLLGIMNSKMMDWFYRSTFPSWGDPWNDGRPRYRGDRMKQLPLAATTAQQRREISDRVKKIQSDPFSPEVPAMESQIDQLVYALYELTEAEIAVINRALPRNPAAAA